jgi:hypothetical protein
MEPEEDDPHLVVGWHVVEVGLHQAWPFVGLADPESGREVRIYIDATFSVRPGWVSLGQEDDGVFAALASLVGTTIQPAEVQGDALVLDLGDSSFMVAGEANAKTTHSPWWIGAQAAGTK